RIASVIGSCFPADVPGKGADDVGAFVGRAVVDDDYFFLRPRLGQRAFDGLRDPRFRVEAGYENRNEHLRVPRKAAEWAENLWSMPSGVQSDRGIAVPLPARRYAFQTAPRVGTVVSRDPPRPFPRDRAENPQVCLVQPVGRSVFEPAVCAVETTHPIPA